MELWFHHWFHQDQDWWGLHQTNNQTWFNIKTSQCQYKVSATRLKISVLRKCGILEQTIANIWIIFDQTVILFRTFDWRPSCIYTSWSLSWWRKVARLRSDVKRKKTIKSNNKNLFRIFTCRNLDIYLDNFGCLLVEMSFIGDWSGPPVWKISLQNEENAEWPFESTPLM